MTLQLDLYGVPWLGTVTVFLGVLVVGFFLKVLADTVRQYKGNKGVSVEETIVEEATQDREPPTQPGVKAKKPKQAKQAKQTKQAQAAPVHMNNHKDIRSPLGLNGSRTWFNRVSPLFYEEGTGGQWKISLGRVAFWAVLTSFLGMCFSVQFTLGDEKTIDPNLPTLYLGVISMLFLTVLGLLGYNLGAKFTEPMTKFILAWAQAKQGVVGNGQAPPAEEQPQVGNEPPV